MIREKTGEQFKLFKIYHLTLRGMVKFQVNNISMKYVTQPVKILNGKYISIYLFEKFLYIFLILNFRLKNKKKSTASYIWPWN